MDVYNGTAMEPRNKHQLRTEATRRALLKSARRIFAHDGFEACRLEDITAAIGHTRGAFYAHFRTKEDLFFALLEQEAEKRLKQIDAVMAPCTTMDERIAVLREFFVSRISDRRWAMLIMEFKLFAVRHPALRPRLVAIHRRIRASLKVTGFDHTRDDLKKAALEAVLAGFSLEHAYDPVRLPKRQGMEIMGALFDTLFMRSQANSTPDATTTPSMARKSSA
jgi:AcrR family transcriptional regulator